MALVLCAACAPAQSGEPRVRGADELRATSPVLRSGSAVYTLEVEAWRSVQPIVGSAGDPLIAILRLSADGEDGVPGALGIEQVYLVHGAEVVQAEAREEEPRASRARTVEFVLRDGPRWPVGDAIDVVVTLSGLRAGTSLLRAPRVAIARVD